jgi:hypothetical protein
MARAMCPASIPRSALCEPGRAWHRLAGTVDAIEFLLDKLRQTKSNSDFFESMNT